MISASYLKQQASVEEKNPFIDIEEAITKPHIDRYKKWLMQYCTEEEKRDLIERGLV